MIITYDFPFAFDCMTAGHCNSHKCKDWSQFYFFSTIVTGCCIRLSVSKDYLYWQYLYNLFSKIFSQKTHYDYCGQVCSWQIYLSLLMLTSGNYCSLFKMLTNWSLKSVLEIKISSSLDSFGPVSLEDNGICCHPFVLHFISSIKISQENYRPKYFFST